MKEIVTWLGMIGRIHPRVFDYIFPHGHKALSERHTAASPMSKDLGERDRYLVHAALLAHDVVDAASTAAMQGQPVTWLADVVDDWCGTGWPRRWPTPWPQAGPDPIPWHVDLVASAQMVAAIVFATASAGLRDDELSAALADGAERLARAALGDVSAPPPRKAPRPKR